jgi:hypothetical protein
MIPERIKELRAICDAATAGPWTVDECNTPNCWCRCIGDGTEHGVCPSGCLTTVDATFCAHARTALPDALDEIERQANEISDTKEALHMPPGYEGGLAAWAKYIFDMPRTEDIETVQKQYHEIERLQWAVEAMIDFKVFFSRTIFPNSSTWTVNGKGPLNRRQAIEAVLAADEDVFE